MKKNKLKRGLPPLPTIQEKSNELNSESPSHMRHLPKFLQNYTPEKDSIIRLEKYNNEKIEKLSEILLDDEVNQSNSDMINRSNEKDKNWYIEKRNLALQIEKQHLSKKLKLNTPKPIYVESVHTQKNDSNSKMIISQRRKKLSQGFIPSLLSKSNRRKHSSTASNSIMTNELSYRKLFKAHLQLPDQKTDINKNNLSQYNKYFTLNNLINSSLVADTRSFDVTNDTLQNVTSQTLKMNKTNNNKESILQIEKYNIYSLTEMQKNSSKTNNEYLDVSLHKITKNMKPILDDISILEKEIQEKQHIHFKRIKGQKESLEVLQNKEKQKLHEIPIKLYKDPFYLKKNIIQGYKPKINIKQFEDLDFVYHEMLGYNQFVEGVERKLRYLPRKKFAINAYNYENDFYDDIENKIISDPNKMNLEEVEDFASRIPFLTKEFSTKNNISFITPKIEDSYLIKDETNVSDQNYTVSRIINKNAQIKINVSNSEEVSKINFFNYVPHKKDKILNHERHSNVLDSFIEKEKNTDKIAHTENKSSEIIKEVKDNLYENLFFRKFNQQKENKIFDLGLV